MNDEMCMKLDTPALNKPLISMRSSRLLLLAVALYSSSGFALNGNQIAVSNTILDACANTNNTFALCDLVSGEVPTISDTEAQEITPDQILAIGSMATRITGGQISLLNGYVADRTKQLHDVSTGKQTGGGAGDDFLSPLGFWFKADTSFGQRQTTPTFTGFRFNNFGLTAGADYRVTNDWVTGLAFTYKRGNSRLDSSRGDTDNDAYLGSIYTSYYITEGLHVEATGSYGGLDYETTRNIHLPTVGGQVRGTPGAEQYSFSFGGGYDFTYQSVIFAPFARTDYIGLDVDPFSENGGVAAVRFNKQNIRSMTSTVGAQISSAISFPWGILTPQIRGEWHHQFLDEARTIKGSFISDPTSSQFILKSGSPDNDFYTLGGDLSATFAQGASAFLSYQTLLGSQHIESHSVMLGTRLEF